jgi:phosphoribosylformimino-5-aminoimidazole carboxamide ribotide isomerase
VRLLQGRIQDETVYAHNPQAVARQWAEAGAQLLHVVDLDAAILGNSSNQDLIRQIIRHAGIPVQVGGGMRDLRSVQACLELGAHRVVVGTAAAQDLNLLRELCRLYPNRIAVGIDARNGFVATHGWTRTTNIRAADLGREVQAAGAAVIIFTDIYRDGMQTGPNIAETRNLAKAVSIPVIASGGVGRLEHLRALLPLEADGVTGVICGKAFYSGSIKFAEALELTSKTAGSIAPGEAVQLDKNPGEN